jgi:hypothetical protein
MIRSARRMSGFGMCREEALATAFPKDGVGPVGARQSPTSSVLTITSDDSSLVLGAAPGRCPHAGPPATRARTTWPLWISVVSLEKSPLQAQGKHVVAA